MVKVVPNQIESDSIHNLKDFIRKAKKGNFIEQYIAEGDKEVSFDGYIILYNDEKKEKRNYERKVFVQVKGKNMKNSSPPMTLKHDVKIADLKNYLKEDGVIYFVIALWYGEDQSIVNYKCYGRQLHNALILDLLATGNKSKVRVDMYQITQKSFYRYCMQFCMHQDRQKNHRKKLTIKGNENMFIGTPEDLIINPQNGLPINDFYTYKSVEIEGKTFTLTGNVMNIKVLSTKKNYLVKCSREERKMEVKISNSEKERIITFNDVLEIRYKLGSDQMSLKLSPLNNIEKYIDALWLYGNILQNHSVQFGENTLSFNSNSKIMSEEMNELKKQLIELRKNFVYLNIKNFDIGSTGDFSLDFSSISNFNKACIQGDLSVYKVNHSTIYRVPMGGSHLLIYYDNEKKEIDNVFKDKYIEELKAHLNIDDKKISISLPFIFGLNSQFMTNLINYNHEFMYKHIEDINAFKTESNESKVVTQMMLELIDSYDKTMNTEYLSLAKILLDKLPEETDNNKTIKLVNKCQILRRESNKLLAGDKEYLLKQKVLAVKDGNFYKALNISVVLENPEEAKFYYDVLEDNEKEYFKKYPLFSLYAELIRNEISE